MTGRIRALLFLGAVTSGCAHWDLDDPTPGFVDVATPPPVVEQRHIVPPRPAGEKMLLITAGVFGSIGFHAGEAGVGTSSTWGGETTVHWGEREWHHTDELGAPPVPAIVYPRTSWGLTFGGSARSASRSSAASNSGNLYLEIQRNVDFGAGFAAGPVWEPQTGQVGAQMTLFATLAYLRLTVLDLNPALQIGLMMKLPLTWVWSR
jgi:hypothetical protein